MREQIGVVSGWRAHGVRAHGIPGMGIYKGLDITLPHQERPMPTTLIRNAETVDA